MAGLRDSPHGGNSKALHYALCTASMFIDLGNFASALEYLEYADGIAGNDIQACEDLLRVVVHAQSVQQRYLHTPRFHTDGGSVGEASFNDIMSADLKNVSSLFFQASFKGGFKDDMADSNESISDEFRVLGNRVVARLTSRGVDSQYILGLEMGEGYAAAVGHSPHKTIHSSYCTIS
jgi:hypothetical protein